MLKIILKKLLILKLILLLILLSFSCSKSLEQNTKVDVYTSIPPIQFLIDNITGGNLVSKTILKPGSDPHTFEITAKEIDLILKSKLYISVDLPFENILIEKLRKQNKNFKLTIAYKNNNEDIHLWTSITRIKILCENIFNALAELNPENKDLYASNYKNFLEKLNNLDFAIKYNIDSSKIKDFLIIHPALTYFAEDYGLNQISIEEEGKVTSTADLIEISKKIKEKNIRFIFIQPEFPEKQIEQFIKDNKLEPVTIDILGYNIFDTLLKVSETFVLYKK